MFMRIYRVQHAEYGTGPFVEGPRVMVEMGDDGQVTDLSAAFSIRHPNRRIPRDDGISLSFYGKVFGCDCLEGLFYWFSEYIQELEAANYIIAVYDVESYFVLQGHTQVAFDVPWAQLIETLPMSHLHTLA
jgi:hypothetical protein